MKGIILPTPAHGKITTNSIIEHDLCYYTVIKIDPRYGKKNGEPDNEYKYFVRSKINGELMNFAEHEIKLVYLSVYDYDKYFNENKRVFLGNISPNDLKELKYKIILENNLTSIEDVYPDDMIELKYEGEIIDKAIINDFDLDNTSTSTIKYFKLVQKL
jgi:hypothetical protein